MSTENTNLLLFLFSATAQTIAALIAVSATFAIIRFQVLSNKLEKLSNQIRPIISQFNFCHHFKKKEFSQVYNENRRTMPLIETKAVLLF